MGEANPSGKATSVSGGAANESCCPQGMIVQLKITVVRLAGNADWVYLVILQNSPKSGSGVRVSPQTLRLNDVASSAATRN